MRRENDAWCARIKRAPGLHLLPGCRWRSTAGELFTTGCRNRIHKSIVALFYSVMFHGSYRKQKETTLNI